jgi:enoyl-CoA hydratase/carnithine racemase
MQFENILLEKEGGLVTIMMNRPETMNKFSPGMIRDLAAALDRSEQDREVRVIVITGQEHVFSAGGDITLFDRSVVEAYRYQQDAVGIFLKIERLGKPVIAEVRGYALGGGCELAMACDLAFAAEDAQFGLPEVNIGAMPGFAVVRLQSLVGRARAKELMLTGARIDGKEAERIGLINRAVPADELGEVVANVAHKLAGISPLSAELIKSTVNRQMMAGETAFANAATSLFWGTQDIKEGMRSFFEKRSPRFRGE